MEINLKVEIKGLSQLSESLALLGSALAYKNNMVSTSEAAVELMDEIKTEVPDEKDMKAEEEKTNTKKVDKPKEEKTKKETKSKFTREDVRASFVSKNSPATRNKLKALLDKFDAPNITELEEKHFDTVMKELEAL